MTDRFAGSSRCAAIFHLVIDDKDCFFGVDFSGIDLGRRDYRIFLGMNALKGNIAAALLSISKYDSKHALLDPFCRHGIIPIEAALLATNTSIHKFDKDKFAFTDLPNREFELTDNPTKFEGTIIAMDDNFKHVSSAKKNAKIAGVIKAVSFSRTDLRWLDAKFGKHFLDRIITLLPPPSRNVAPEKTEKTYHQFFYQADFILKKSGKICLVMQRGTDLAKDKAKEFKFKIEHERKVQQGGEELSILVFSK